MFPVIITDNGWSLALGKAKLDDCRIFVDLGEGTIVDVFAIERRARMEGEDALVCDFLKPGDFRLAVTWVRAEQGGVHLQARLHAERPLHVRSIVLGKTAVSAISLGTDKQPTHHVIPDGEQPGMLLTSGVYPIDDPDIAGRFVSVLANHDAALLFGIVGECRFFDRYLVRDGHFRFESELDLPLAAGAEEASDTFYIASGDSPHEVLTAYSRLFQRRRGYDAADVCGWNSWDYYFFAVDEEAVYENMAEISRRDWLKPRAKCIVIDAGWAFRWGDWRPGPTFGCDLSLFVERCRRDGFVPGIWIAPFSADPGCVLARRHPEIFCQGPDGRPEAYDGWLVLDPTHPGGEQFMRETFRYLYDLGFRYFKTDYLYTLLYANLYHRRGMGKIEVMRHGLTIIREEVKDSYFLGCGAQDEAAVGICDGNRLALDINTFFANVRIDARTIAVKYWQHKNLFIADPDFLIVRSDATADDLHHNSPMLATRPYDPWGFRTGPFWQTENESRCWATMVLLSGGPITLSDRLSRLNEVGWRQIRTVFDYFNGEAAIPLDLLDNAPPRVWYRPGEMPLLAIFNWENEWDTLEVDLEDAHFQGLPIEGYLQDIWQGPAYRAEGSKLLVEVPPRDVILLALDGVKA
ncbi:MAG: glycoside hydrolase family 36 protein [Anaerolineae bacterium]